jgi:hypothetical protein
LAFNFFRYLGGALEALKEANEGNGGGIPDAPGAPPAEGAEGADATGCAKTQNMDSIKNKNKKQLKFRDTQQHLKKKARQIITNQK